MTIPCLIFLVIAAGVFAAAPVRPAILAVYLGGLMLLPIADYGEAATAGGFPFWIVGPALPTETLVAKTWIAPLAALILATIRDGRTLAAWRPGLVDLPMALWCAWPALGGLWVEAPSPAPWLAALQVLGCWGLPWVLGRAWFSGPQARIVLLRGIALAGVACLPFAVLEGVRGPFLHDLVYGPHPFRADGALRYVGFRPLGFFINGNLYGIWVAAAALAAIWCALARQGGRGGPLVAALALGVAVASQSAGALLLLLMALALLATWRARGVLPLLAAGFLAAAGLLALHVSGVVPVEHIARNTALGQTVLDGFRAVGRGSFLWRISQDLKSLAVFEGDLATGVAVWDWWRAAGTRPWGLLMLMAGQYGLVAVAAVFAGLAAVVMSVLVRLRGTGAWRPEAAALPLAAIVLMALGDAMLNAFFLFPAVLAAGAMAGAARAPRATDGAS
ncbi:hypothetical protein [uncultured Albimonas sp.]|uniref:hypothetical protein n=1 Tax=uncultured Albimonas sp. TaxID=1331701 RepID=UPI0030EEA7CF